MKTLFVLRHAKSSWENPKHSDFERVLNERGLLAAPKMGEFMKDKGFEPDFILSSPAMRAKQTAELVKKTGEFTPEIRFEPRIYEASFEDLLSVIRKVPGKFEKVLLVGHNPGFEHLIENLTGEIHAMPTAALAHLELKVQDWQNVHIGTGHLLNLFKPKEIAE